ncbi:MAG: TlpA family protein disulfide reductase [Fibrobacteres bacterium]|nr:TlpA family protein disulfide reductase [Fibrobacterota bacterium]
MKFLLALVLGLSASSLWASGDLKIQPGQLAPRFNLVRLDDPTKRLSLRDLADSAKAASQPGFGKFVILSFWSTTCVNCRAEMPRIQTWLAGKTSVEWVPVLVENVEPEAGLQWLKSSRLLTPGILDRYQAVGKSYGVCQAQVCTVPALVVIGPDQKVRLVKSGYRPTDSLEVELNRAIAVAAKP